MRDVKEYGDFVHKDEVPSGSKKGRKLRGVIKRICEQLKEDSAFKFNLDTIKVWSVRSVVKELMKSGEIRNVVVTVRTTLNGRKQCFLMKVSEKDKKESER